MCPIKKYSLSTLVFSSASYRTGVHHPLSSPEVPSWDSGLLYTVLCEGHHRAVDHASEWYEVSETIKHFSVETNLSN